MPKWLRRLVQEIKGSVDWLLFVTPMVGGWFVGPFIAGMYVQWQFAIHHGSTDIVTSMVDDGKAAAALSLFIMTIIALVTQTKIKSALFYSVMTYAGFMIAMAAMLNDTYSIKIEASVELYVYVAIGVAAGAALPCFVVTLAQRYFPVLNSLKNKK